MASREREVKVVILGEDKGASKALNKVDDAAAKLGPSGKIAGNALDNITSKLTSGLGPASGEAKAALDKVGTSAVASGGLLKTALAGGAIVAGAALAKFAFDGAMQFVSLAAEVRNFQRASGASAEESSRFVAVLDDLGISSDKGASAIFKLAKTAADGGTKLREVGVEVARNRDNTVNLTETLLNAADAYSSTTDPAKRAEIAFAAFGKQGKDLIPILEQGRTGLQQFFAGAEKGHQIFSQSDLDKARKYELALDDLQDSLRGLQLRAGPGALQAITAITQALADGATWIDEHSQKGSVLGEVFSRVWKNLSEGPPLFRANKDASKESGDEAAASALKFGQQAAALEEAGFEVSELERETGQLSEENKKATAAAEKYKQKIDDMGGSISSAYSAMSGKSSELTEKQRDLARSFDESKSKADSLKQGLDILVGVHLSAAQASINWEAKIRATSTALLENTRTLDITTEAGRDNQSAIIGMIQAGLSHVDALQREGASSQAVAAAYADHVQALRNVMRQAGYSREEIERLLNRYGLLAAAPDINKRITTTFEDVYVQRGGRTHGGASTSGIGQYAHGMEEGPIPGGRNEVVPILAHGGEWVVTPQQMAALKQKQGYGGSPVHSWSQGSGDTYLFQITAGTLVGEDGMRQFIDMIQSQLLQKQRRVVDLGLT